MVPLVASEQTLHTSTRFTDPAEPRRTWPLLLAVALLLAMPFLLSLTHRGRVAVLASIYLPDMVLQVPLPVRPIELITDAPKRERITIEYESRNGPRSIEADLRPSASTRRRLPVRRDRAFLCNRTRFSGRRLAAPAIILAESAAPCSLAPEGP